MRRRLVATALLSFSTGLPLALTSDVLQAWVRTLGHDLRTTGAVVLVGLPMALQACWAPFIDRFAPRLGTLGRRRSWMLVAQLALVMGLVGMAFTGPGGVTDGAPPGSRHSAVGSPGSDDANVAAEPEAPGGPAESIRPLPPIAALLAVAVAVACAAAVQEIAFNAWRSEVFPDRSRALGASIYVAAYRVAMVASGGGVLIIAGTYGFRAGILAAAMALSLGLIGTLLAPEPPAPHARPPSIGDAILAPLRDFLGSGGGVVILLFVLLYKLPDYLLGTMTIPLLQHVGLPVEAIGMLRSVFGIAMTIVGALIGGAVLMRLPLRRALLIFGLLQLISNAGFLLPAAGFDARWMLIAVIAVESFCTGLVASAFVAFFMASCTRRHAATQYALLTTIMLVGSRLAGPVAGAIADALGWTTFVMITIAAGVPGLIMIASVPIREERAVIPDAVD